MLVYTHVYKYKQRAGGGEEIDEAGNSRGANRAGGYAREVLTKGGGENRGWMVLVVPLSRGIYFDTRREGILRWDTVSRRIGACGTVGKLMMMIGKRRLWLIGSSIKSEN